MKEYSEEVILIKFPIIKKEGRYEISGLTTHLNMPQYEVKLKLSKQKLVVEKEKNQWNQNWFFVNTNKIHKGKAN